MAQMKKVQFENVAQRVLSKHLRQQGIKVEREAQDALFLRTDKANDAIVNLAQQLPGAVVRVSDATKQEARAL